MIIGALGQGAMFSDQDIALSFDNFHTTCCYLCTAQFEKAITCLNLSGKWQCFCDFLNSPESDLYHLLDGPHLSPFTAHTNMLQATVDQLIQQAAFCSVPSAVSS